MTAECAWTIPKWNHRNITISKSLSDDVMGSNDEFIFSWGLIIYALNSDKKHRIQLCTIAVIDSVYVKYSLVWSFIPWPFMKLTYIFMPLYMQQNVTLKWTDSFSLYVMRLKHHSYLALNWKHVLSEDVGTLAMRAQVSRGSAPAL